MTTNVALGYLVNPDLEQIRELVRAELAHLLGTTVAVTTLLLQQ